MWPLAAPALGRRAVTGPARQALSRLKVSSRGRGPAVTLPLLALRPIRPRNQPAAGVRCGDRAGRPPPAGIPADVMPGDTGGAPPAPPHGAATSYRRAAGPAAPAVSQLPP